MRRPVDRLIKSILALTVGVAIVGLSTLLILAQIQRPRVSVDAARLAPTAEGADVFLTIRAHDAPDRLIGVASSAASLAVVARAPYPEAASAPPIPHDTRVELAADANHVKLLGLTEPLPPGGVVDLTLVFERAGAAPVRARIMEPDAAPLRGAPPVPAAVAPRVQMSVSPDPGGGWRVTLATERFRFAPNAVGKPHRAGEGHARLFVDGVEVARMLRPDARIGSLPPGLRTIRATLVANDRRPYRVGGAPVTTTAEIYVENSYY